VRARRKGKSRRGGNRHLQKHGTQKTRRNVGPAEAGDHGWSFETPSFSSGQNLPREFVLGRDMRELPNIREVTEEEEVHLLLIKMNWRKTITL
jgi:hypothetical protein